ncbi:uncharacterized protein [Clytia hemisphaerica]|uniref:SH2 domain-containing protein n=1 Tax=Clytia hemisphaerica TaxID=252671 RepID=A0A7M5XB68_9CNID|eukprot:TCONS_00003780-protein
MTIIQPRLETYICTMEFDPAEPNPQLHISNIEPVHQQRSTNQQRFQFPPSTSNQGRSPTPPRGSPPTPRDNSGRPITPPRNSGQSSPNNLYSPTRRGSNGLSYSQGEQYFHGSQTLSQLPTSGRRQSPPYCPAPRIPSSPVTPQRSQASLQTPQIGLSSSQPNLRGHLPSPTHRRQQATPLAGVPSRSTASLPSHNTNRQRPRPLRHIGNEDITNRSASNSSPYHTFFQGAPATPAIPLSPTTPMSPSGPWNQAWGASNTHPSTEYVRYIDGKLEVKEKKALLDRYNEYWYVVKGKVVNNVLSSVKLFKFKDSNTHLEEHFIESCDLSLDRQLSVTNIFQDPKKGKYSFDLFNNKTKMSFRTYDKMIMYRWIYVFHDLIAQGKSADELPNLVNNKIPSCIFYIVGDDGELVPRYQNLPTRQPSQILADAPLPPRPPRRPSDPNITNFYTPHHQTIAKRNSVPPRGPPSRQGSFDKNSPVSPRGPPSRQPSFEINNNRGMPSRQKSFERCKNPEAELFKVGLQNRVKYYHRGMKRQEAEQLLETRPIGTYLIRDCSRDEKFFVLSYRDYIVVKHLEITYKGTGNYSFDEKNEYVTAEFVSPEVGVELFIEQKHRANRQEFHPHSLTDIFRRPPSPENSLPPFTQKKLIPTSPGHEYEEVKDTVISSGRRNSTKSDISAIYFHIDRATTKDPKDPKYVNYPRRGSAPDPTPSTNNQRYVNYPPPYNSVLQDYESVTSLNGGKERRRSNSDEEHHYVNGNQGNEEPHYENGTKYEDGNGYTRMENPYIRMGRNGATTPNGREIHGDTGAVEHEENVKHEP